MENNNVILNDEVIILNIMNLINTGIKHFNEEHAKYKLKFDSIEINNLEQITVERKEDDIDYIQFIIKVTKKNIIENIKIRNRRIINIEGYDNGEKYDKKSRIYCFPTILNYCGIVRFENNKYIQCVHYHSIAAENLRNKKFKCLGCYKCEINECSKRMNRAKQAKINPMKEHERLDAITYGGKKMLDNLFSTIPINTNLINKPKKKIDNTKFMF